MRLRFQRHPVSSSRFVRLRIDALESRHLMAADWQNADLPCDVDNNQVVVALDALLVINSINRDGPRTLTGKPSGASDPRYDTNGDGELSAVDALVVINAINRALPTLFASTSLAPNVDSDSNGVLSQSSVSLDGTTGPYSKVSIQLQLGNGTTLSSETKADESGAFRVTLPLENGLNQVSIRVRDEVGAAKSIVGYLRRGGVVSTWNATFLNELRVLGEATATVWTPKQAVLTKPPGVARNLAIMYIAMFDAINAVEGGYQPFVVTKARQIGANSSAAVISAAHRVLTRLYSDPSNVVVWDATLTEQLRSISADDSRQRGIDLGIEVADSVLASRAMDGSSIEKLGSFENGPGKWKPSAPTFEAVLPQWPNVLPFVSDESILKISSPPSLASAEYASAVQEVANLGSKTSTTRTPEQTAIAQFWADGSGTASPPGHWNQIASDVIATRNLSLIEQVRTMALLNIAMADAGIGSWKAKYDYDLWRPVDAIRGADLDVNPATSVDPNWTPLVNTPSFPTYVSGHSAFSSAASAVLTRLFGANASFRSQKDIPSGWKPLETLPDAATTDRAFASFAEAAEEAGVSRIYGGIHFSFDNRQGLSLGERVGKRVVETALKKL